MRLFVCFFFFFWQRNNSAEPITSSTQALVVIRIVVKWVVDFSWCWIIFRLCFNKRPAGYGWSLSKTYKHILQNYNRTRATGQHVTTHQHHHLSISSAWKSLSPVPSFYVFIPFSLCRNCIFIYWYNYFHELFP